MINKTGFGGGCHWCTEAVFSSVKGVVSVAQGWIASQDNNASFSEGVIVEYDSNIINLKVLIEIHLHTHSSTAQHSMRDKYRSAVYIFQGDDIPHVKLIIKNLQPDFDKPLITEVLRYAEFKLNRQESLDYYFTDPERPFCENYINPKLKLLMKQFSNVIEGSKLIHLQDH